MTASFHPVDSWHLMELIPNVASCVPSVLTRTPLPLMTASPVPRECEWSSGNSVFA